jgi:hypothetical protein
MNSLQTNTTFKYSSLWIDIKFHITTSSFQYITEVQNQWKDLKNEFILLFGDGVSPEKKWRETASLHVVLDAKFPSFFFRMIAPSPNKTNKLIPYYLIISKHKYYVIKLYILHDLFLHYILWSLSILWHLSIYVTDRFFQMTQNHLNSSINRKACYMENQMIKMSTILKVQFMNPLYFCIFVISPLWMEYDPSF